MRFLLRSGFWLTAAYFVLAPHAGADVSRAAHAVGEQVAQVAPQVAAAGVASVSCEESLHCEATRAAALRVIEHKQTASAAAALTQAAVAPRTAPVPPQRPEWAS